MVCASTSGSGLGRHTLGDDSRGAIRSARATHHRPRLPPTGAGEAIVSDAGAEQLAHAIDEYAPASNALFATWAGERHNTAGGHGRAPSWASKVAMMENGSSAGVRTRPS